MDTWSISGTRSQCGKKAAVSVFAPRGFDLAYLNWHNPKIRESPWRSNVRRVFWLAAITVLLSSCRASSPPAADSGSPAIPQRSEEHTSELQSLRHLVCRLLLEKKNNNEKDTI